MADIENLPRTQRRSISKAAIVAAPGAGATLVSMTAANGLAAGLYIVQAYLWISGALIAGDANNVKLSDVNGNVGGVDGILCYPALANQYGPFTFKYRADGINPLNMTIVGASATTSYGGQLIADLLSTE